MVIEGLVREYLVGVVMWLKTKRKQHVDLCPNER
jgi:hypothetical protein